MSNLLDKASVILTPTAYNNGEALCVKPSDGSGDFDFSRNSAATRVNAQGLVENVQILSSNLVQNGDFSEEGAEEVTNGSFSQEGVQLVTNGDFSNGLTDWVVDDGTSWTNVNNTAFCDGNNGLIKQGFTSVNNKTYKITFDVVNVGGGELGVRIGSGTYAWNNYPSGSYVKYLVSGSSTSEGVLFYATSGWTGSIDNVSVREVGQDWTLGTGWSIGEDKAVCDGTNIAYLTQTGVLNTGTSYKVQFDIVDYTSGSVKYRDNGLVSGQSFSGVGSYTDYVVAGGGQFRLMSESFIGSVTNISVKEVGMDWGIINATITDVGNLNGTGVTSMLYQDVLTNGSTYTATFTISNYNSIGNSDIINAGGAPIYVINSNGTFTITFTHTNASGNIYWRARNSAIFSIDNISIIEISNDTNLPRINYEGFSFDGSGNIIPNSGCGSWLFEPQSTNLVLTSDSGAYGSTPPSETNTISPDGTNNAIIPTPTTNSNRYQEGLAGGVYSNGQKLTYSWYRKRISTPVIDTVVGDLIIQALINLTIFESTTQIQSNINGYDRFQVVVQVTDGSLSSTFRAYFGTIIGVGNSSVAYWGHQFEVGGYATSLIPTDGSQTTRNQDLCTNGGSLATINSTEGVLYAEIAALSDDISITGSEISISDGTSNNLVRVLYSPATSLNSIFVRVDVGGVRVATFNYTSITITDFNKVAVKWKENDFALWINGIEVLTDLSGATFSSSTLSTINFSKAVGGDNFYGKTKCLAVWKEALSDQELAELTTI